MQYKQKNNTCKQHTFHCHFVTGYGPTLVAVISLESLVSSEGCLRKWGYPTKRDMSVGHWGQFCWWHLSLVTAFKCFHSHRRLHNVPLLLLTTAMTIVLLNMLHSAIMLPWLKNFKLEYLYMYCTCKLHGDINLAVWVCTGADLFLWLKPFPFYQPLLGLFTGQRQCYFYFVFIWLVQLYKTLANWWIDATTEMFMQVKLADGKTKSALWIGYEAVLKRVGFVIDRM